MRDLKIIGLTLLAVYLYQHTTQAQWNRAWLKTKRVIAVVLQ